MEFNSWNKTCGRGQDLLSNTSVTVTPSPRFFLGLKVLEKTKVVCVWSRTTIV